MSKWPNKIKSVMSIGIFLTTAACLLISTILIITVLIIDIGIQTNHQFMQFVRAIAVADVTIWLLLNGSLYLFCRYAVKKSLGERVLKTTSIQVRQ